MRKTFEYNFHGTVTMQEAYWNGKVYNHTAYVTVTAPGSYGQKANYKLDLTPGSAKFGKGSMQEAHLANKSGTIVGYNHFPCSLGRCQGPTP